MGRRVTQNIDPIGIPIGNDRQIGIPVDDIGSIDQFIVHLTCQGRLGQTATDRGCHFRNCYRFAEFPFRTVGKPN